MNTGPIRISCTLVTDGSRDLSMLQHVVPWVIRRVGKVAFQIQLQKADFGDFRTPPSGLPDRLKEAVRLFPCDVLFIHRDAEAQARQMRVDEIAHAVHEAGMDRMNVPVVPVRMTEAWFLTSESAIRKAADNPNGQIRLNMPPLRQLERLPDPKRVLHDLLVTASEKQGRRAKAFLRDINWHVHRIGDHMKDYAQLENLPAFRELEKDTQEVIERIIHRRQ